MDGKISMTGIRIVGLFSSDYRKPLMLSEIARLLGINHRTARIHVDSLHEIGVLETETRGRNVFVRPSPGCRFIRAMVAYESLRFVEDDRYQLREVAGKCIGRFCIIFGSFALGNETEFSDIDIITDKAFSAPGILNRPQLFVFKSLKKIPDELFSQIAKAHIVVKGYEEFVDEMVRRYGFE